MSARHGARASDGPIEKDYTNVNGNDYLDESMDTSTALKRIQTAGSISISPELFEKIYLSPQQKVSGDLRRTFANPTPIALVGFLLALTPLSCMLMGWRGAGGAGAASIGAYLFFGGLLMILGGVGEFIVGNTFPCVVFLTFGAYWLTYGVTLQPSYNAYALYSTTGEAADGLTSPGFNASFAFFLLWMGVFCLLFTLLALRTNVVFLGIFLFLTVTFALLAAAFWHNATGEAASALKLQKAGGACAFIVCLLGWYIFAAVMMASTDFPFSIPVGDLSTVIKGASEKAKMKKDGALSA